jgi:hypothetical protein
MGGHGALIAALRNPGKYKVSPIIFHWFSLDQGNSLNFPVPEFFTIAVQHDRNST